MGDLISRKALLEELNNFSMKIGGSANAMALVVMDETKKSIAKMIENQHTAFDLESVIVELEKKRDYCYAEMKKEEKETDYFSEHIFEEYHNQGKAYNDCLEILTSAANATNGKIGG